jgi:hypothetical protein
MNKKIIQVSSNSGPDLAVEHLQYFLQTQGLQIDVSVDTDLLNAQKTADLILVNPDLCQTELEKNHSGSQISFAVQFFDAMLLQAKKWLPEVYIYSALKQALLLKAKHLDTRSPAIVVGNSPQARVCVYLLVSLGYSHILIVSDNDHFMQEAPWQHLNKICFQVQLQVCSAQNLLDIKISGSVFVYADPWINHLDWQQQLSYFSFLKNQSFIVDLHLEKEANDLLTEASKVGHLVISGLQIKQNRDTEIIKYLYKDFVLSEKDYQNSWPLFLQTKNPTSV